MRRTPGRPASQADELPATITGAITELGGHIATARLRRQWRLEDLATKAGISKNTLVKVEAGNPGTTIASYVSVLWALGLLEQLNDVARPNRDAEGEALAAARLGERVRPAIDDAF